MTKIVLAVVLCLALLGSIIPAITSPAPAQADGTPSTTLAITIYGADGSLMKTTSINYSTMQATLPVQGDGTTHYYCQGPTFVPTNLWDPAETLNLKDKGTVQGTDLKDLCNLVGTPVGGIPAGATVKLIANDGYGVTFQWDNISNNSRYKFVICWKNNGSYTDTPGAGQYTSGMQLVFFDNVTNSAGQHVFGAEDMKDFLPPEDWHYWVDNSIQYPSCDGISVKWISQINISLAGGTGWNLQLNGSCSTNVSQDFFEDGVACQHAAGYTDGNGDIWHGMPLGFLCGLVDDTTNLHGAGAFNFALANAGYTVTVYSIDGRSTSFSSTQLVKNGGINGDILVANILNDAPLPSGQSPLALVGADVAGNQMISNISRIVLSNYPPFIQASAGSGGSISPSGNVQPNSGADQLFTIVPISSYRISGVTVDGLSAGTAGSYTFHSVTSYHTISASFMPIWDLNNDHVCNIGDVGVLGSYWYQRGSGGWIPQDLNGDGVINIGDVGVLGSHWHQTW